MALLLKIEALQEINDLLENAGLSRGCGPGERWGNYNRGVMLVREWRDSKSPSERPRYEAAARALCDYLGGVTNDMDKDR